MAAFTPGNLVVYRIGTGAAALSNASTAVFLDEYTPAGVLVQSIAMPTADSGANQTLTASGTSVEGFLNRSEDGRYLVLTGYDAAPGVASIATSTTAVGASQVLRVIGRVDADGNIDTTTTTTAFSGGSIRSAVSADGSSFWAVGANTGVIHESLGASTHTVVSNTFTTLRSIDIFGDQLYVSAQTGSLRIGVVGSGEPTTSGQTISPLPGIPLTTGTSTNNTSPYQFVFADLSAAVPGVDTLYVADDRTVANGGGLYKFSLVDSAWVLNGVASNSLRGLTGSVSGTTVNLYATTSATSANSIVSLIDTGGYNAAFSSTTFTTVATAAANTGFRGIDFAPQAAGPVTPALSINDVSQDENTGNFVFTVTLSAPAGPGGVTFDIATANGTAIAGSDYTANALIGQTIPEGETSYQFTVQVTGDTDVEPNETFFVNVTNVTGATVSDGQGQGTIVNDDTPPSPAASVNDVAIAEGNGGVTYLNFTVTLSFAPTGPVTIDYSTANGTATAGSDYLAVAGTLNFAAGETVKTVSVPIIGDTVPEDTETFTLNLSNASGATIADNQGIGTITNDDGLAYFPLNSGSFEEYWTNTARISTNNDWSQVPYIRGFLGDIDPGDPANVNPTSYVGPALGAVQVWANLSTNFGSGGVGEFEIADPTIALQGSGTADAPSIVLYMDATGRSDIRLQALLRDIDATDNAAQQIAVQYRTSSTGNWINVPGGYYADVTTGGSATQTTPIDLVLPAGANNAPRLEIRILTTNASGSDEWVGIDDIVVSSQVSAPSLSIADAAAFEGTAGGSQIVFTVTRAGDTSGASTADYTVTFAGGGFSASADDFATPAQLTGTVQFAPGESSKTIPLDLVTDGNPEADEGFTVTLSNPSSGTTIADGSALGTIVNDDGPPPLVTISDVTQAEGNSGTTTFTFTVTRTGGTGAFTVDYATSNGSATAGSDYVATMGTLSFAAGENSRPIEVQVIGDGVGEFAETFSVNLSNPTGFAVIADTSGTGTIQNDDLLYIHQIQGSSYYSPILAAEGKNSFNVASTTIVTVQAIVTAVDANGNRQGFYITEETGHWDSDWLTSEGIFVMTRDDAGNGTAVSGVAVGDLVTVTARVMEYQAFDTLPRTMLVNPSVIVNSSGNTPPVLVLDASRPIPNSIMTLVTPDFTSATGATFDATRYALSFWETVEGMLVTLPDVVVADGNIGRSGGQPFFQAYSRVHADADQINSRGGYTIAGDPPSSPPDTADPDDDTIAGGRHLHDGDTNPDIIEIDFSGFATPAPAGLTEKLSMGDGLGDVTGIVEFDFTDRKLFVTNWDQSQFVNTQPTRETTALGSDPRSLTVATFNVENLDPGDGAARFAALAQVIATNLKAPDIVIVEEIQDNNGTGTGTNDASITWQMLVDALNAAVPGAAYQWVDQPPVINAEGGEPNGNIRVGFLYNTVRVQLGDLPADATIAERRQYTDRIGDGVRDAGDLIQFSDDMIAGEINTGDWSSTRLSLLGQFTFSGNTVFVVGNHFTAKGGSGNFWQFDQDVHEGDPANAGWAKRNQQALDVYTMINHIQTNASGVGIVAGGDFNDFYFYRPLEVVTGYVLPDGTPRTGGSRFDNLILTLPEAERYTYTFDGRSQALDHVVVNSMLSAVATYDIVHVNTGYNALGTGADTSQRLSDHDPALASFDFRSLNEILVGTPNRDVFRMEQGGDDHVSGLAGDDTFYFGAAFTSADFVDGGPGTDSLILDGDYSGGVTLGTGTTPNMVNVETLSLVPARSIAFDGSAAGSHSYRITTVDGNVAAGGLLKVNAFYLAAGENVTFDGSAELDGKFIILAGQGTDTFTGGSGNDVFVFGHDGRFSFGDVVNGGAGYDVLYLRGDYSIDFGMPGFAGSLSGIESIFLAGVSDTRYTAGGDGEFDYAIVWNDAMPSGAVLTFNASTLNENETFSFDGRSETATGFRLFGGAAADVLRGGAAGDLIYGGLGADTLEGGGGNDVFLYYSAQDSTPLGRDGIQDFALGDIIDLSVIDADVNEPGNQAFTFIGSNPFTFQAGQLRVISAGVFATVQGDTDGDGIADLEILLVVQDAHPITAADFVL
jgi:hypothetical protein